MQTVARQLSTRFGTDADARRLTLTTLVCVALVYGNLAAASFGLLPAWTLLFTVSLLVPRWMIGIHELFHLRSEREVDPVTRLQPLLFTPLSLGYRENLVNHRSHHRFMVTPQDAEYYQLRGSRVVGFLNAMSAPEQMWFRWIAENGVDRELAIGTLLRLAIFVGLVAMSGWLFLWYWLPARAAFGASYFVFFYWLHRKGEAMGVYPLVLPKPVLRVLTVLYGADVVEATVHHDVHHAQPRVASYHLNESRSVLGL
jgi:fatty acid desaturase